VEMRSEERSTDASSGSAHRRWAWMCAVTPIPDAPPLEPGDCGFDSNNPASRWPPDRAAGEWLNCGRRQLGRALWRRRRPVQVEAQLGLELFSILVSSWASLL
jgi:hypothetical protein